MIKCVGECSYLCSPIRMLVHAVILCGSAYLIEIILYNILSRMGNSNEKDYNSHRR